MSRRRLSSHHAGSRESGSCTQTHLFVFFSTVVLSIFGFGTYVIQTVAPPPLPRPQTESFMASPSIVEKLTQLKERSEALGHSLNDWRSRQYEAQGLKPSTAGQEAAPESEKTPKKAGDKHASLRKAQGVGDPFPTQPRSQRPPSQQASTAAQGRKDDNTMLLLVGGTDGSGTRSVVDMLQNLGVFMAVDDTGTMDVHGEEMKGGWPPPVKMLLKSTDSMDYEVANVPAEADNVIRSELRRFVVGKEAEMRPYKAGRVTDVRWGFKAPVSMLLVPYFHDLTKGLKFLHVVRDGRDIAFSGNQSPVRKFYDINYGITDPDSAPSVPAPVKAIQLWNDWNVEMSQWSERHHRDGSDTFHYLRVRTEDVVNPETKHVVYKKVAAFVGAKLTDEEICCMVRQPAKWMGSHESHQPPPESHHGKSAEGKLKSRYGSWREKVKDSPDLQRRLEEAGAAGLEMFGYTSEVSDVVHADSECPAQPKCDGSGAWRSNSQAAHNAMFGGGGQHLAQPPRINAPAEVPPDTPGCQFEGQVDFRGPTVDLSNVNAASAVDCCDICAQDASCTAFTFQPGSGVCYLKNGRGVVSENKSLVSGVVVREGGSAVTGATAA